MSTLTKIKSTADITGGSVFFATAEGFDPEYPENGDLLPDGMYIRLEGSDGSLAYISAYELDKSMDIIGQMSMSKASKADVEALETELNDKVSNTDFELLQNDLTTKADQSIVEAIIDDLDLKANVSVVDSLTSTVADKADKTTVDSLTSTVADKADKTTVDSLTSTVADKADKTTVDSLKKDVEALKKALGSVSDASVIDGIQRQIEYLNDEINKRLTVDDLAPINTNISNLSSKNTTTNERIDNVELNLGKKASTVYVQGQVSELNHAITSLASVVDTKASKKELANKADKSDVDSLTKKVTTLSTTVNGTLGDIDNNYRELSIELSKKADKNSVNSAINSLESSVSAKIDKAEAIATTDAIENRIDTLKSDYDEKYIKLSKAVDEINCDSNSTINGLTSTVNSHTKQLSNYSNEIVNLKKKDNEITEQLKQQWVRVMTPEEYKKLPPIGSTYGDGKPNPYAKQPNVIYMLVRYNKPISVYIGDVLIAQAEQKGQTGFAYSFPITF